MEKTVEKKKIKFFFLLFWEKRWRKKIQFFFCCFGENGGEKKFNFFSAFTLAPSYYCPAKFTIKWEPLVV